MNTRLVDSLLQIITEKLGLKPRRRTTAFIHYCTSMLLYLA
ncbi:hypothetical protein [Nodularia chucula]